MTQENPQPASAEKVSADKAAAGRPALLNDFQRGRVCGMVLLGASRREIANILQVHPTTIARTAERDAKFAKDLVESEELNRLRPMKSMFLAMENHWRAAAWMLERMHPDQFGRQRKAEMFARREVREVVDRLLECVWLKVTADDDREELRQAAERLCGDLGKKAANPYVEMEMQMDELKKYQRDRDERLRQEQLQRMNGRPLSAAASPAAAKPNQPR